MALGRTVDRPLVILMVTLLSGLLGGLFGVSFWTVELWLRALLLLGGTVIGAGTAFFLLTVDQPETGQGPPQAGSPTVAPPPGPAWPSSSALVVPSGAQTDPAKPFEQLGVGSPPERHPSIEHARITLPLSDGGALTSGNALLSSGTASRRWWTETPSAAGTSDPRERSAPRYSPAPPLSSYERESALIAQCPRCGEFRLDVSHAGGAYAFRCRNGSCGNTWSWTPGTPWPPVVVRRNLSGGSTPGSADTDRA